MHSSQAAARKKKQGEESDWIVKKVKDADTEEEIGGEAMDETTSLLGYGGGRGNKVKGRENGSEKKMGNSDNSKKRRPKKKPKGIMEQMRGALGLTAPENSGWLYFGKTDLKTGKVESRGKVRSD